MMMIVKVLTILFSLVLFTSSAPSAQSACGRPGLPSDQTCYYKFKIVDFQKGQDGKTRVRGTVDDSVVKKNAADQPKNQGFDVRKYPYQLYMFNVKDLDKLKLEKGKVYTFVSQPTKDFDRELQLYESQ